MELTGLATHIAEYIAGRAEVRLDKFDKDAERQRKVTHDAGTLAELECTLEAERKDIASRYLPINWLADAAMRAKQIQMVTHALKFTHTDARGSSFYFPGGLSQAEGMKNGELLCTASLTNPAIDVVGNAAALDVAALLQMVHEGKTLIQYIEQGDSSPLQPFANDEQQLAEWMGAFKQALSGNELSSHKFAKQLYFPVADGQYHLLAPLYSSSLAHALNIRIAATRYPDEIKLVRKAKKDSKYNSTPIVDYPDTAVRSYGGTKPQNVSQLNSSQGGKSFLLSCAPPNWKVMSKPPLGVKSVFSRNYFGLRVRKEVWSLQQFLLKKVINDSAKPIRDQRTERVDQVLDQLVQYAAEIQNLTGYIGWSALPDCKLSRAEQLWLDPRRAELDAAFAAELDKNDWQTVIADQFARWFNSCLKHEKLTMGDTEHIEWKKLALEVLG
ncbi:MAG: type I-F CRISPR-associated protein Csy1 [Oryzomonas sp.]|uniref:type I-F CRISPR-associated protein Csy1 n=1 Tax=Oryzomonas sp. TaxID=2855186 RepID=UPI0028486263|nr:type I-F CRISPR-associated protein Csy1 [Oryzomonas sp.]MDR3578830.1 type I-F CRISPR-associated protein Csy1 [Oryzomonas sp.]